MNCTVVCGLISRAGRSCRMARLSRQDFLRFLNVWSLRTELNINWIIFLIVITAGKRELECRT